MCREGHLCLLAPTQSSLLICDMGTGGAMIGVGPRLLALLATQADPAGQNY